jgi:hypothetical protein
MMMRYSLRDKTGSAVVAVEVVEKVEKGVFGVVVVSPKSREIVALYKPWLISRPWEEIGRNNDDP